MVGDGVDTKDALRQMRKSILTFTGIVVKIPDLDSLETVKDGLDRILKSEGHTASAHAKDVLSQRSNPSSNGSNVLYAAGRYSEGLLERLKEYMVECSAEMHEYEGKERHFDGPYWICNVTLD